MSPGTCPTCRFPFLSEDGLLLASVEIGVAVLADAGGEGREEEAAAGLDPLPDEVVVKEHGGEDHHGYLQQRKRIKSSRVSL